MGFKVSGKVEPVSITDNYPVIDPLYGIDGLRCVATLTEMYDIPLERRRGGMIVGVQDNVGSNTTYYKLKNGIPWQIGDATNWDLLLSQGTSSVTTIKNYIANENLNVLPNYQYLVYGDLIVATGGTFVNSGSLVIINGTVSYQGGTLSNVGSGSLTLVTTTSKYSATFSIPQDQGFFTVSHGLGTDDIVYSIRDGYNFIYPNVEILDTNEILIKSIGTISDGRINIVK
jgi:hypothetical protein